MENKRTFYRILGLAPILFVSPLLMAENTLSGNIYALIGESDNAFKSDTDKVDERQDEYGVNLAGTYANSLVDSNLSYQAKDERFREGSQGDRSSVEGNSSLLIGKEYHPLDLLLSHSRTSLLKEPGRIALTDNQDSREIFSVAPSFRGRLTSADTLRLTASFTDIKFLETDQLDSSRQGASLAWIHRNSPIQQMQIVIHATDVEFDKFEESNYAYRKAMLSYSAVLRKLNYSIEFGYNQSDPEFGETSTSPSYSVALGYNTGLQEIELTSSQMITDSSFGSGNQSSVNELPGSDGSTGNASRLERRDSQVRWTTSGICTRCTLSLAIFVQDDDYLTEDNRLRQLGGNATFRYIFSDAANLAIGYSSSERESEGSDAERNYDLKVLTAEYSYNFINGLGFRLRVSDEKRSSDISMDEYSERFIGAGVNYRF